MPIPIVVGFTAWLLSLLGSLVAFFASVFTARVAIATAGVAALIALVLLLKVGLDAAMAGLVVGYPTGYWATGLGLLPDNTNSCIAATASARAASWIFAWKVKMVQQYTGS